MSYAHYMPNSQQKSRNRVFKLPSAVAFFLILIFLMPVHVSASDQFTAADVTALEGNKLKSDRYVITLWGIKVPDEIDPGIRLRARSMLDRTIAGQPITCRVIEWKSRQPHAQCMSQYEQDLALVLLQAGYAYTDREQLFGSSLSGAYTEAESRAVMMHRGLWYDPSEAAVNFLDFDNLRPDLKDNLFILVAALAAGPIFGFVVIAIIMFTGFGRLISMQRNQISRVNKDERDLREREKFVLASSLEGEIAANKSKVEAFVTIYKELLRDMRNPNKVPKYQQTGDIVHEKPSLVRMTYDANLEKFELLGPSLAGFLTKLYAEVETSPKYQSLDPDVPLNEAEARVENIIVEAEALIPSMEKILTGLNVIIRGKAGNALAAKKKKV